MRAAATSGPKPVAAVVFDLDGTLYRGTVHVRRYADALAQAVPVAHRAAFRAEAHAYLAGEMPAPGYDDWDSLARIARRFAADPDAMQDAFERTRAFMLTDACPLTVPEGLAAFLDEIRGIVFRLAVSNSPASSVDPLLARLDLLRRFDRTESAARKPGGLVPRVRQVLETLGLTGVPVLSVGDHWKNDIEPARQAGWDTAYVKGRPDFPDGPATAEAASLEALLPFLRKWVREQRRLREGPGDSSS